jgi:hypothetical protein
MPDRMPERMPENMLDIMSDPEKMSDGMLAYVYIHVILPISNYTYIINIYIYAHHYIYIYIYIYLPHILPDCKGGPPRGAAGLVHHLTAPGSAGAEPSEKIGISWLF